MTLDCKRAKAAVKGHFFFYHNILQWNTLLYIITENAFGGYYGFSGNC